MPPRLLRLAANNYRSLKRVDVPLRALNVLVGANGAGKSNFLDLIQFLGDSARVDLPEALALRGGLERVRFRGKTDSGSISIRVSANVTRYSSFKAPDQYELTFYSRRLRGGQREVLIRNEAFQFKRTQGRGRRITVSGDKAEFVNTRSSGGQDSEGVKASQSLRSDSLALSTLQRLPDGEGGAEIRRFAELFTSFRIFDVNVDKARLPVGTDFRGLESDASNLASALSTLKGDSQIWRDLVDDARAMVPGLKDIIFSAVDGPVAAVAVQLQETGLRDATNLADASYGTIRLLALLALLYDPNPPAITCIEEIDHGLHPYLFDRLVERLREASNQTQLLIATHSPALVNRLRPDELLVAERSPDGSSRLPAVDEWTIESLATGSAGVLQLGELWFSGTLGGVPRD